MSLIFKFIYNFLKYRLYYFLSPISYYLVLPFLMFCPWLFFHRQAKRNTPAKNLRLFLESMGPTFCKFGQLLSTRKDLLPESIAEELSFLQDRIVPFPGHQALEICKNALGYRFNELRDFEITPLASASIAQVHAAKFADGNPIIIKVRRPSIECEFKKDIRFLRWAASLSSLIPGTDRYRLHEVVHEFESVVTAEMNFLTEAANAFQIKKNFEFSNNLYVPKVYFDFTTENVLVMERIFGIPVKELTPSKFPLVNFKKLAENGVEIFLTQVFEHSFFHADMHPGNLFVNIDKPDQPQYRAVDFGMIGILTDQDIEYLALNLYSFFERDYRMVVDLHIQSGWVPQNVSARNFELDLRTVCEPLFEKPLKEISFGVTLLKLIEVARKNQMIVQPQLILLQKTLMSVEGLGRQLYPDLDLWKTAKPFLKKWLENRFSMNVQFKKLKRSLPLMIKKCNNIFFNDQHSLPPPKIDQQMLASFYFFSIILQTSFFVGFEPYTPQLYGTIIVLHMVMYWTSKKF